MAVHFVYRSPYEGPSGKHVKHFPDDTVLAWFRRHWNLLDGVDEDDADKRVAALMGTDVYCLASLCYAAAHEKLPPPKSDSQLREYLEEHLYVECTVQCRPHAIQALTDDDEVMLAYFFFDDHFAAEHPDRVAFLLHEDWGLPGGAGKPGFTSAVKTKALRPAGKGEGATYVVITPCYSSDHLEDLFGSCRIDGVRLPDLARHLAARKKKASWHYEMLLTKSQLFAPPQNATAQEKAFLTELRPGDADDAAWMAYSDWLQEQGEPPAGQTLLRRALSAAAVLPAGRLLTFFDRETFGALPVDAAARFVAEQVKDHAETSRDPKKTLVHVEEHLAQLCAHVDRDEYDQWYFFDDLWAGAHPDLANSLLNFGNRWDSLSSPRGQPVW